MAASVTITTPTDFGPYWALLTDHLLRRYRAAPVHSLAEMHGLRARFPDRIRLYQANVADEPVGGVVVYFTGRVARAQYIAASAEGRRCGALDRVFDHLLRTELAAPSPVAYFDFGASTEQNGHYLNAGVIGHKEGFGGRGIVYEQYEYDLLTAPRLLPAT